MTLGNSIFRSEKRAEHSYLTPPVEGTPTILKIDDQHLPELVRRKRSNVIDNGIFFCLCAGLAWIPLWYGSNNAIAWGINAILFPGLALTYELALLVGVRPHPVRITYIALPGALFIAAVLWICIQTSTWIPATFAHPIYALSAETLGNGAPGSISVDRDLTNIALMRLLTAASVFWVTLQLCRDPRRAYRLYVAIVAVSTLYAFYGLMVLKMGQLPFLKIPNDGAMVSATFYNRDLYATYAGLGLIVTGGLMLQLYADRLAVGAGSWRHQVAGLIEVVGQRGAVLLAAAFSIMAALFLTGSRGGIIATGIGLLALGAHRRHAMGRIEKLSVLALSLLFLSAGIFGFGDIVTKSFAQRGLSDPSRIAVYEITLRSILDKPLLGFGYGTFADVFPMYRDRSIAVEGVWEQAHNTYLEVFQGLGLVFGTMLIGAVVTLVFCCCRGVRRRQQQAVLPRIAIGAACLVGVHALVDFSLQIQAIALSFMAILGAGVAQSQSSRVILDD